MDERGWEPRTYGKRREADQDAAPSPGHHVSLVPAIRQLADIKPGDHLCFIYESDEEHREVITEYIRHGLEHNQKILYIADEGTNEQIRGYLSDDGLDPAPYLQSGQLLILSLQETCLKGGSFDPEAMIRLLSASTDAAVAEGYAALRVTGEMTWALRDLPGADRLIEYENLLNAFIPDNLCIELCQYDRRRFSPEILIDVILTHPHLIIGVDIYYNAYSIEPNLFGEINRKSHFLNQWIQNLKTNRRLVASLEHERQRADTYLDIAGVMIVALDRDGTILLANQKTAEVLGIPEEDLIGEDWFATAIPKQMRDEVRDVHSMIISGEVSAVEFFDNPVITRSGEERIIAWHNVILRDEYGSIAGTLSSGEDVTELRNAEADRAKDHDDLLESEHRLSDIINFLPDATFAIDEKGVVIAWNHAIEEMTGVPVAEMIGKGDYAYAIPFYGERRPMLIDLAFKDDLELQSRYDLLKEMPDAIEAETKYAQPKGEDRILWARVSPLYNRNGEYSGAIETIRDITQRKKREEAIARSKHLQQLILASVPDILIRCNAEGRYLDILTPDDERLVLPRDEVIGKTVTEVTSEEIGGRVIAAIRLALETGELQAIEYPLTVPAGTLHFEARIVPYADDEVIALIRDITTQKEAEDALHERIKELSCLYQISAAIEHFNLTETEVLRKILEIIPEGFQHPEKTHVRITIDDSIYTDTGYTLTNCSLVREIPIHQQAGGTITVCFDDEYEPLTEESVMLRIIAEQIGRYIERVRNVERLQQKNEELAGAEEELRSQFDELVATQQQLRESEEYTRTVLDNLPIGVAVNSVDPEVNFEYFNENFFRIYRTTADALKSPDAFWDVVYEDPHFRSELRERVTSDSISGDPDRMVWEDIPITREGEKTTYISARNIPVPGKDLWISTVWDVTGRVEAEREIQHRLAFESMISGISSRFVTESDVDIAINKALGDIGEYCGASRSYVFLIAPSGEEMSNTHEWCADGVPPMIETLQKNPTNLFPWWMEQLRMGESIHLQSLDDLPPEAAAERAILELQGVKSLIVLPLLIRSGLAGFIGFDNVGGTKDWTEKDVHLLKLSSELIGSALEQKQAEEQILLHIGRTEALLALHRIAGSTEGELMDSALNASLRMTDSRYAFIGLMNEDESVMTVHAWSHDVMEGCRVGGTPIQYPIESAGVWGECVRTRTPTIINDYAAPHPAKHGLPEGHLPISRYLGVPIQHGSRIVAIIAVANKEDDYLDDDVSALVTLGNLMGELIFRQRAEAALQESEEKYRLLVENQQDLVVKTDNEGKILYANPAYCRLFDKTEAEILGTHFMPLVHPDDQEVVAAAVSRLFEPPYETSYEERAETRYGWRWIAWTAKAWQDDQGQIIALVGTGRDITEQKEAEEKLRQFDWIVEKELPPAEASTGESPPVYGDVTLLNTSRIILDGIGVDHLARMATDVMLLLDTSLAVYESNGDYAYGVFKSSWCRFLDEAAFRLCGVEDAEQALSSGRWLCHENCWNESAKTAMESRVPTDIECVGGIRLYAVPIFAGGEVIGAVNIGYGNPPKDDATLRMLAGKYKVSFDELHKKANAYKPRPDFIIELGKRRCQYMAEMIGGIIERNRAEESLILKNAAIESSINGVAIADLSGILTYVNPAFLAIWGYDTPDEVIGRHVVSFWRSEEAAAQVVDMIQRHGYYSGEMEGIVENGTSVPIQLQAGIVHDASGTAVAMMGSFIDITDRKRSEDALKKSEERYRYVSTIITDFAYSCLKEDGGDYQIDWMAGATEQITGYGIDEVIAEGCWGFMIHPDDWQIFEDSILSLPEGESSECDLRIIRKDGNIRWLSAETRCIHDETGRSRIYGGCRDITEEKTARLELEQNQARLELAMEAGGIAWWEMDCLTGEVAFSPRKAEMLGYSPDQFSHYTDFTGLLHPDDHEMAMEAMRDHLEGRAERYEVEYRIQSSEGAYLWFRDTGAVTERNKEGAPLKVVGLVVNVTTMKDAVEALRESEKRFKTLFMGSPVSIIIHDRDTGEIIDANPKACESYGCSSVEELKAHDFWLDSPYSFEDALKYIRKAASEGPQEFEWLNRSVSGEFFREQVRLSSVVISGVKRILATSIDITERKKAEMALRESEALLSTAGRMARFGGWSINLNENRVIWSDEVARIHGMEPGYSPSLEEGISFYAPEWKEKITRVFGDCVRNGSPYDEEMEIITRSGERRWVRATGEAIMNEYGRIIGVHGAFQDITQRKEAEEAWKKAYAQIEDNMVQFSVLNDQIRNPLTVIMALADLEGGESAEKIMEQVKAIDQIVTLLDQGVLESESIRKFMRRHDQLSG